MRELLWTHRRLFFAVAAFSFFVNLLQLGPSFYWMAVFDRVMTSRSEATLFYLTIGVAGTLFLIMFLEILRSRLLVVITIWIDKKVAPVIFDALVTQGGRPEHPRYPEGMRDLHTFRNYITGSGIFALFDAPWLPIYLCIIFLFSKTLGYFALGGVAILVAVGWVNEKLSRDALETMHREMSNSSRFVDTVSRNAESVLTLGMLPNVRDRWAALNDVSLSRQAMTANVVGSTVSLTRLVRQIVQIMMLCAGAWLILEENTSPGVMMAATFIASRALVPVEMILSTWTQFAEARAAYGRLDSFLVSLPAALAEAAVGADGGHRRSAPSSSATRAGAPAPAASAACRVGRGMTAESGSRTPMRSLSGSSSGRRRAYAARPRSSRKARALRTHRPAQSAASTARGSTPYTSRAPSSQPAQARRPPSSSIGASPLAATVAASGTGKPSTAGRLPSTSVSDTNTPEGRMVVSHTKP